MRRAYEIVLLRTGIGSMFLLILFAMGNGKYCGPVFVVALSLILFQEKITKQKAVIFFHDFIEGIYDSGSGSRCSADSGRCGFK